MRVGYSLVGGDSEIDGDMFRINVNFGWHALVENAKKLGDEWISRRALAITQSDARHTRDRR